MKKTISLILCMIIVLVTSFVYATEVKSFSVKLNADKTILKSGDSLEVIMQMDEFTEEKGVNVFLATLEYDKQIFEEVQQKDIKSVEYWSSILYNPLNGKLVIDSSNFVNVTHDAIKINFKVKQDTDINKITEIKLKQITSSNGENDIYVEDAPLKVQVGDLKKADNTLVESTYLNTRVLIVVSLCVAGIVVLGIGTFISMKGKKE